MRGIISRFAPAPTGFLHLGHVVNAVYVWRETRARAGTVLLRIEDHDRQRSRPEFEAAILEDLAWLGFEADAPPVRQSARDDIYRQALDTLRRQGLVYACSCTRADVARAGAGPPPSREARFGEPRRSSPVSPASGGGKVGTTPEAEAGLKVGATPEAGAGLNVSATPEVAQASRPAEREAAQAFRPEPEVAQASRPAEREAAQAFRPEREAAQAFRPEREVVQAFRPAERGAAPALSPADPELRYPGTCRDRGLPDASGVGLRVRLERSIERFDDLRLGPQEQRPSDQCGDLLVRDRDGNWTYQFAATVDDLVQGVTLVVRGVDLLASTGRQIQLARLLGRAEPPAFLHHPLIMKTPTSAGGYGGQAQKLSKSDRDTGIRELRAAGYTPAEVVERALALIE